MSSSILRRNSSKLSLQNLIRVTAQRSVEDAEEVEREHRRKARESFRRRSNSGPGDTRDGQQLSPEDPKPDEAPSLEEDEGFSDWSHRRERENLDSVRLVKDERDKEHQQQRMAKRREEMDVFIQQEVAHSKTNRNASSQEVTSYIPSRAKRVSSSKQQQEEEEQAAMLEKEKMRKSIQEANQELMKRREERCREEQEKQQLLQEEEERRRMKSSSVDGGEAFSSISATPKISQRAESLSSSLKKSVKTLPLSVEDRRAWHAHAAEQLGAAKLTALTDSVGSRKQLFGGESRTPPGTRTPGPKDVNCGDVMQKKNMWENMRETGGRGREMKSMEAPGNRFKFVVTGHGKYKKICVGGVQDVDNEL